MIRTFHCRHLARSFVPPELLHQTDTLGAPETWRSSRDRLAYHTSQPPSNHMSEPHEPLRNYHQHSVRERAGAKCAERHPAHTADAPGPTSRGFH